MALVNKISLKNLTNHNALTVYNKGIKQIKYDSLGGPYACEIGSNLPYEFQVVYFMKEGDTIDIVAKLLLEYLISLNTDVQHKFEYMRSCAHPTLEGFEIYVFCVRNENTLSSLIWKNENFLKRMRFLRSTLTIAYEQGDLMRIPTKNGSKLFSLSKKEFKFGYGVDLPKIESLDEAISIIKANVIDVVESYLFEVFDNINFDVNVDINDNYLILDISL